MDQNQCIFQDTFTQTNSLSQITCTLIRHAQSQYNKKLEQRKKQSQSNSVQHHHKNSFQFDFSLIDPRLTQQGIKQATQAKKKIRNSIEIVFVSPLQRALQTANIIFRDRKDVKIKVIPELTEFFKRVSSISLNIIDKQKRYPNMDFSWFINRQIDWQVYFLDESKAKGINLQILKNKQKSEEIITQYYFNLVKEHYPKPLQNREFFRKRVRNSIEQIKNICKQKCKNIAVISHNKNLKELTSSQDNPEGYKFLTCEILEVKL